MALVVEDGTAKTDANAFVSLDDFKTYCDTRGKDYSAYDDTAMEQAIVRGTDYVSESHSWKGYKVKTRNNDSGEQALAWPRYGVVDGQGYSVDSESVPWEIKRATFEVAFAELVNPGLMQPVYTSSERVRREKIGEIEVEYDVSDTSAESARPVLLAVRDIIGGLLSSTGGSRIAGTSYRV